MASKESNYPPLYSYLPPEPRRSSPIVTICIVVMAIVAVGMGGTFVWRSMGGTMPTLPVLPTTGAIGLPRVGGRDTGGQVQAPSIPQAHIEATAQAQYDAAVQQMQQAAPAQAPALPSIPTAIIAYPTALPVEQVTIQPIAMPDTYAAGSDVRPTPVSVMPYPTALPDPMIGAGVSADGKCVQAERGGATYQVCQEWGFTDAEARSVADYLRTGLVPGEEVK